MVEFATEYCAALDIMTADRDMNLHKFELSKKQWGMGVMARNFVDNESAMPIRPVCIMPITINNDFVICC